KTSVAIRARAGSYGSLRWRGEPQDETAKCWGRSPRFCSVGCDVSWHHVRWRGWRLERYTLGDPLRSHHLRWWGESDWPSERESAQGRSAERASRGATVHRDELRRLSWGRRTRDDGAESRRWALALWRRGRRSLPLDLLRATAGHARLRWGV